VVVVVNTQRMLEGMSATAANLVGVAGKSPYAVVLSDVQRRELQRRAAAYSGPHRDVVRAKAILYAGDGMSNTEIAARLDQSRQAVSEWRKRFCQEGVQGLEERPRPGRPRRFSPGAGGRGQGAGMRAAGDVRGATVTLVGR
jgi:DNA-directed RNA polymerase specialized sigma24 family protein